MATTIIAEAGVNLSGSSALTATTIRIYNYTKNQNMLTSGITIDVNTFTSYVSSKRSVINPATDNVSTGDLIGVDILTVCTGTLGLMVLLGFSP